MVYNEEWSLWRAQQARREYERDPAAWTAKMGRQQRIMWIVFTAVYVPALVLVLVHFFPTTEELQALLRDPRLKLWLPAAAGFVGLGLYLLKRIWLIVYAGTELGFALASCISATTQLAGQGLAAWTVVVGVIYLFSRGFENLGKGFVERQARLIAKQVVPSKG